VKSLDEIPEKFKSIEGEAEWWDTHDLGDILDQFEEEVQIEVMKKPKKTVTIRMSEKDIEEFKRISKQLGIKYTALIRSLAKRGLSDLKHKIMRSWRHLLLNRILQKLSWKKTFQLFCFISDILKIN